MGGYPPSQGWAAMVESKSIVSLVKALLSEFSINYLFESCIMQLLFYLSPKARLHNLLH